MDEFDFSWRPTGNSVQGLLFSIYDISTTGNICTNKTGIILKRWTRFSRYLSFPIHEDNYHNYTSEIHRVMTQCYILKVSHSTKFDAETINYNNSIHLPAFQNASERYEFFKEKWFIIYHDDDHKWNNSLPNLQYATPRENIVETGGKRMNG